MTEFDTLDKNMKNKKNWHGDQDVYTQNFNCMYFFLNICYRCHCAVGELNIVFKDPGKNNLRPQIIDL